MNTGLVFKMVTFAKSELKKYALTMYLVLLDENIDHKLYKYNKPKKKTRREYDLEQEHQEYHRLHYS